MISHLEHEKVKVTIEVGNTNYNVNISIRSDTDLIAEKFLKKHSLPIEYKRDIMIEMYKAQLIAANQIINENKQLRIEQIEAQERSDLAERHASNLMQSIERIEMMLPLLIASSKKERRPSVSSAGTSEKHQTLPKEKENNESEQNNDEENEEENASSILLKKTLSDNEFLRDQSFSLRKEIIELQLQIEEIQQSAMEAFRSFHTANPPPKDDSSLEQKQSDLTLDVESVDSPSISPFNSPNYSNHNTDNKAKEVAGSKDGKLKNEEALSIALQAIDAPIVVERIIDKLYTRYAPTTASNSADSPNRINLTRFIRLVKELGISKDQHAGSVVKVKDSEPMLDYGDVVMVFTHAVANKSHRESEELKSISKMKPKGWNHPVAAPTTLGREQFLIALEQLALKNYARLVEQQTGSAWENLSKHHKQSVIQAVLDLIFRRRIIPFAVTQGLIPWGLVHLDRALSAINTSDKFIHDLIKHCNFMLSLFRSYCATVIKENQNNTSLLISSSDFLRMKMEQQKQDEFEEQNKWLDKTLVGLTEKGLTRLARSCRLVPFIIRDSLLQDVFREISNWTNDAETSNVAMDIFPQDLRDSIHSAIKTSNSIQKRSFSPQKRPNEQCKNEVSKLNFPAFIVLLCTIAIQSFPTESMESRPSLLFDWINKNHFIIG